MLIDAIKKVLRRRIKIIDSASPAANNLKNVLMENNLLNSNDNIPTLEFYVTGDPEKSSKIADIFFGGKFPGRIEKTSL